MSARPARLVGCLVAGALLAGPGLAAAGWTAAWAAEKVPPREAPKGTRERLDKVKRQLDAGRRKAGQLEKQAQEIDDELARLRRDMVAAAHIIQEQEKRAGGVVAQLTTLKAEEAAKLAQLRARRGQLAGVLVALQRVARYPPEALVAQPMPPSDTVRSAILLRAVVPEIEQRATRLRDDLDALAQARRQISEKNTQLVAITAGLEAERQRLATLFGQKTALRHRTLAESRATARRVKSLAGEARSLRDLMNRLRREPGPARREDRAPASARASARASAPEGGGSVVGLPDGLTGTPITRQRGKLPPPAVGDIVGRYGQSTGAGLTRKGLSMETAAGAQVVAPYEGRVVFAGKFRGYGELLIIEHGEGYHSLLSGLARIDSTMGQWVVAGEPVGVMGRPDGRKPVLYVELRRNGQPINPLPWLAARR